MEVELLLEEVVESALKRAVSMSPMYVSPVPTFLIYIRNSFLLEVCNACWIKRKKFVIHINIRWAMVSSDSWMGNA